MDRPRRVVDLNECYWLMGARYGCTKCHKSVVSWNPGLLAQLAQSDPDLAAIFPAHLTHRSGMDKGVFSFMASAFGSGMGPRPCSDSLHVRHKEAFKFKHIQYLKAVERQSLILPGKTYLPFGRFDVDYAGFIPSAPWLRDLWDNQIERMRPLIEQSMSMIPVRIGGIDHLHQFPKRIVNVNGTPVVTAAMDVTAEYAEIRQVILTPTKAHEAFEPSFEAIQRSFEFYGYKGPEVMYTDNISDAQMLMRIFPSLAEGIQPANKWGHLPVMSLDETVTINVIRGLEDINNVVRGYLFDGNDKNIAEVSSSTSCFVRGVS
jgi:hypothetical protein